jgi:hypothetical protein
LLYTRLFVENSIQWPSQGPSALLSPDPTVSLTWQGLFLIRQWLSRVLTEAHQDPGM